jgi:hypothetical protein
MKQIAARVRDPQTVERIAAEGASVAPHEMGPIPPDRRLAAIFRDIFWF